MKYTNVQLKEVYRCSVKGVIYICRWVTDSEDLAVEQSN